MSERLKQAFFGLFHGIEEWRQFTGYYRKLPIPGTPRGSQSLADAPVAGSSIIMLNTATRRAGIKATVVSAYEQNGFVYIVTDICGIQRLQDIKQV